MRTILIALALVAAGAGFVRVTGARATPAAAATPAQSARAPDLLAADFLLRLSAAADFVEVAGRSGAPAELTAAGAMLVGSLELDAADPWVDVRIVWRVDDAPASHRFAKLILEIPGRPTIERVLDGRGDFDERLELPALAAP